MQAVLKAAEAIASRGFESHTFRRRPMFHFPGNDTLVRRRHRTEGIVVNVRATDEDGPLRYG